MKAKMNLTCILRHGVTLLVLMEMFSCSPILYAPVGQNVSMFAEKGESRISIGTSRVGGNEWGDAAGGVAIQAGVATGMHTSLVTSYYSMNGHDEYGWTGNGRYFEIGVGGFSNFEAREVLGEVIVGTGFGNIVNRGTNGETIRVGYIKPFVQPSIGFRQEHFELAFTPRIAMVNYRSSSDNLVDPEQAFAFDQYLSRMKSTVVFEPGLTVRAGIENLKFSLQYCRSTFSYTSTDDFDPVLDHYISIGVEWRFTLLAKKEGD